MATSENTAAPQPQSTDNQPQGKICYGDCFRCSYQQAWMCASMHARRAMRTTEELMEAIGILTQTVTELKAQVSDLQAKFDKAELINPMEKADDVEDDQEQTEDIHLWPEKVENEDFPGWANGNIKSSGQSATDGIITAKRKR